ncbi:MAG: hypothetical protein ACLT98_16505 [Eggerthellaceae bacterium]
MLWIYPAARPSRPRRIRRSSGAAGVALCLGADFVKVNPPKPDSSSPAEALKSPRWRPAARASCAGGSTVDAETFLTQLYDQTTWRRAAPPAATPPAQLDEAVRLTTSAPSMADCGGRPRRLQRRRGLQAVDDPVAAQSRTRRGRPKAP